MTAFVSAVERANYRHFVLDIAWFGLGLAATTRFMQFYAIRMGASPMDLGWITALPALVLVISSSLSQWWNHRHNSSIQAVWYPSIGFRLVFLLPAFTPFLPDAWRVPYLVVAATLPALPQAIAASVFIVMMRETVTQDNLTPLVTRRALALNIAVTISALIFGLMLETIPFPINYQLMFLVAFGFSMVSQWHLGKLRQLEQPTPVYNRPAPTHRTTLDLLRDLRFQSVAFITLITHVAFFSIFAVIPLHLENQLGATEGFVAIYGVTELLAGAMVTLFIDRVIRRIGNRQVIIGAMLSTGTAALIIALAPSLELTLIGAFLTGAGWTTIGIGVLGFFAERTDARDMKATTVFHQMIFLAMFVGPLMGSKLADVGISTSIVLMGGVCLRYGAALFVHLGLSVFGRPRVEPQHRPAAGD